MDQAFSSLLKGRLAADAGPAAADVVALAAVVDAWQLLRPAVACAVPLRTRGVFSAVWQDAQHTLIAKPSRTLARKKATRSTEMHFCDPLPPTIRA